LMKKIDLSKTVFELTEEHPELVDILKDLGFLGIGNPVVRNTLGRKMTIPQGCKLQGKELAVVLKHLEEKGFQTN